MEKALESLAPLVLRVENESGAHHVPAGAETHFKVILVSRRFTNLTKVARHRLVHDTLSDQFASGLHALSLRLFTPEEWEAQGGETAASPLCQGGGKQ